VAGRQQPNRRPARFGQSNPLRQILMQNMKKEIQEPDIYFIRVLESPFGGFSGHFSNEGKCLKGKWCKKYIAA